MARRGRPRHPDILTPREWEVHALLREGLSNEDIAERLNITLSGAKYHVSEIIAKLEVSDRHEAALWPETQRQRSGLAGLFGFRPRGLTPVLQVASAGLMLVVVLAVGLLMWGVTQTESNQGDERLVAPEWTVRESGAANSSVMVFDVTRREARRIDLGTTSGFLQWVDNDDLLVGYDGVQSDYRTIRLDGTPVRSLLPQPWQRLNQWFVPQNDGRHVLFYGMNGELRRVDAITGNSEQIESFEAAAEPVGQYALDGGSLAFQSFQEDFVDQEGLRHEEDLARLVFGDGGVFAEEYGEGIALELAPNAWSPDGRQILTMRSRLGAVCGPDCREYAEKREYRVYAIPAATNSFVWSSKDTLIIDAAWAGPNRLYVTKYDVNAEDTVWAPAFIDITTAKETIAPGLLATGCCLHSFSRDGRYAVGVTSGSAEPRRCSLIDTTSGNEVVGFDATAADFQRVFCATVSWTADGTKAIVSEGGH